MNKTVERRQNLKEALVGAAEETIAAQGLGALRARALADRVGCAVGGIYNVVADLDELVLLVNSRTFLGLEQAFMAAAEAAGAEPEGAGGAAAGAKPAAAGGPATDGGPREAIEGRQQAIARLVRLAMVYTDFAAANTLRWRALFEHRLPAGYAVPDWYLKEQMRLFSYVEGPLRVLQPQASPERIALLARSVVSAVHGIVALGLEEKLYTLPLPSLREQVTFVVSAIGRGLS
jgi:AcrR family transcriptional regulator